MTRLLLAMVALGGLLGANIVGPPSAKADTGGFIEELNDEGHDVYDASDAISLGYQICTMLDTDNGDVNSVVRYVYYHTDWGVWSIHDAGSWVIAAADQLCPRWTVKRIGD